MQVLFTRVHPVAERWPQRRVPEVSSFGPTSWPLVCFIGAIGLYGLREENKKKVE